ncbi:histone-lysine N-methyltransferase SETMAR-like [Stegodyphus dumicola]|uniref:histone-lysine N-methyltransferase SETMAR-like n=1 Tax=Stegodyphus dumicola TaxID=202533 RepID=UPI0015ABB2E3|nr:histone-lysine N-methyltransferase SETMAR-like [Stegodyphus dumicola]
METQLISSTTVIETTITARKVMLSFFFDSRGPLLIEFLHQGSTINSAQYCSTLMKLRQAIKKRLGLLTQEVILLHNNARPHISNTGNPEDLKHIPLGSFVAPPYSLDMSPCDFHVFGPFKRALQGKRFHSDDGVKEAMQDVLRNHPQSFYSKGIELLLQRWDLCFNDHRDFF